MHALAYIPLRFVTPWALAALPLAALPVCLAMRAKGRGRRLSPTGIVVQCAAMALLVVALSRPVLPGGQAARPWLVLRDVSASLRGQTDRPLAPPKDIAVETRRFARDLLPNDTAPTPAERTATRAAPALDLAAVRANELAGAVLITDGRFTDRWRAAATRLAGSGVDLLIVPLDAPPKDARIADFRAARRGQAVELRLTIAANATMRQRVVVLDAADGRTIGVRNILLTSDGPQTLRLTDSPPTEAAPRYVAMLDDRNPDDVPENDNAYVVPPPRDSLVGYHITFDDGRTALADMLDALPVTAEPIRDLDDAPGRLAPYTTVVLATRDGQSLPTGDQQALSAYVRGGGTLVLLGTGPRQTPADIDAPLNRTAALVPDPFQRSPLDLAVVLDASGSMAGELVTDTDRRVKFDIAAGAVGALQRHLTARDRLRVICFADDAATIYDSGAAAPDFVRLAEALRAVRPAGPTHVGKALQEATAAAPADERTGLVLVLSDLATQPFDLPSIARPFTEGRWQLAVVATGEGEAPDSPLDSLVRTVEGTLALCPNLKQLAELFGSLTRRGRGSETITGTFEVDTANGWEALAGLAATDRLALTAAAPEAEVLATANGEPLLGRRRAGLGWSWTLPVEPTDLQPATVEALASTLTSILNRTPAGGAWDLQLDLADGRLTVNLRAAADAPAPNDRRLAVDVLPLSGDSEPTTVDLPQVALGRYRTSVSVEADATGARVRDLADGRTLARGAAGRNYSREFARLGADHKTLADLAAATAGRIVSLEAAPEAMLARRRRSDRPAWPVLLAAALAIMLAHWAIDRVTNRTAASSRAS
ncbi:MAG: VWA domain-containing protein [Phycisphaerae bacterium]|nr:VWA domain-containing protein [Phycisphaerae bacterium]